MLSVPIPAHFHPPRVQRIITKLKQRYSEIQESSVTEIDDIIRSEILLKRNCEAHRITEKLNHYNSDCGNFTKMLRLGIVAIAATVARSVLIISKE